jgi:hypothetical protein
MTKIGADIDFMEQENKAMPYTLTYGTDWSNQSLVGQAIPKSALSTSVDGSIFFYVKKFLDADPVLLYSDANGRITWVNNPPGTDGKILVNFGGETAGFAARGYTYELRIRWLDGSFTSLETGKLHITPTTVGRPL